jgi:formate dehydrogenase subunit gamma
MSQTINSYRIWSLEVARAILESQASNLILPNLQMVQNEFGYIPHEAIELIAKVCNVSKADVHGVMTYYTDLRDTPAAKVSVKLCVAEACQANGVREFAKECESAMGVKINVHNPDAVELEGVYCLGNCALGPTALINNVLHGRLTSSKLKQLINKELDI